uniref:Ig-like domain-containing protein n=1 Tax=Kryptolebias marmoratus TaxID=37003 RepID=A0A3Q2ZVQ2_KRYMA
GLSLHVWFCVSLFCGIRRTLTITRSYNTFVGESVTLSCVYNVKDGRVPFCWGRESTSCDNVVIQSDGTSVTRRSSWRYLLYGNLYSGDASLTITNLVESDSGMYGCRVEIKGWFNDLKEESSLLVFPVTVCFLLTSLRRLTSETVFCEVTALTTGSTTRWVVSLKRGSSSM